MKFIYLGGIVVLVLGIWKIYDILKLLGLRRDYYD